MTQKEIILDVLRSGESLTSIEAFEKLGITKLTTRISELRRDGHAIKGETVRSKNRFNKNIVYMRYSM